MLTNNAKDENEQQAGGRKMAGKKGQVVQLQLEVNTNDEWNKLLEKEGLIVVDIYSEWCGPCVGMVGTLKKIKLEIGGDFLTFAIAKTDEIDALERFRNRSEPTWMFLAGGHMVNLMLGADAPRLTNLAVKEIEKEKAVLKGEGERTTMPINKLTPEEEIRFQEKEKLYKAARQQEEAAKAEANARQHRKEIRNLMKYIGNYTVILLMPFLYVDGVCEAWLELSDIIGPMGYSVEDEEKLDLDPDLVSELLHGGMKTIPDEFQEKLKEGQAVAKLMLYRPESEEVLPEEEPVEGERAEGSEGGSEEEGGEVKAEETDALVELCKAIYGHIPGAVVKETEPDEEEKIFEEKYRLSPEIPGVWTPYTPQGKANAIMKLFPKFAAKYALPPPPELPPVITLIFDTTKSQEITDLLPDYQEDVLHMAYFSSGDPSDAKKIALNKEQYDQRHRKTEEDRIVLVLNRKKSDPLLNFCQLGPVYVSANPEDGKKDYEAFFAEDEEEDAIAPDETDEPEPSLPVKLEGSKNTEDAVTEYTYEKEEKFEEEISDIEGLSAFVQEGVIEEVTPMEPPLEGEAAGLPPTPPPSAATEEQPTPTPTEPPPAPEPALTEAPPEEEPPEEPPAEE